MDSTQRSSAPCEFALDDSGFIAAEARWGQGLFEVHDPYSGKVLYSIERGLVLAKSVGINLNDVIEFTDETQTCSIAICLESPLQRAALTEWLTGGSAFISRRRLHRANITTANELPGYRILHSLGICTGIHVRAAGPLGTVRSALSLGGSLASYTRLSEDASREAFKAMVRSAEELKASGVIGMRYQTNFVADGMVEVMCYGTAVALENQ